MRLFTIAKVCTVVVCINCMNTFFEQNWKSYAKNQFKIHYFYTHFFESHFQGPSVPPYDALKIFSERCSEFLFRKSLECQLFKGAFTYYVITQRRRGGSKWWRMMTGGEGGSQRTNNVIKSKGHSVTFQWSYICYKTEESINCLCICLYEHAIIFINIIFLFIKESTIFICRGDIFHGEDFFRSNLGGLKLFLEQFRG